MLHTILVIGCLIFFGASISVLYAMCVCASREDQMIEELKHRNLMELKKSEDNEKD